MAQPTIQRDGDSWALAWSEHRIAMGVERLRDRSDGLRAEITVESAVAGRVVGPVELNILSSESQTRFANACALRVNGLSKEQWHAVIVQACAIVAKQFREPTPTLDLSKVEDQGPIKYLIPGLVPEAETTVVYGDGESAKSLLALRVGLSVALGHPLPWGPAPRVGAVLYLDWETNAQTVATRLRRIALGEACMTPTIHYRQCFRSLSDELPHIKEEVSKKEIALVIVDSIGFAASGALVEDETARVAMNALRALSPTTRLVVAHVSKTDAEVGKRSKPFGSAFFWNGMRSGIELRRSDDGAGDDYLNVGVYHWKSNDGRHVKPFGLSVLFDRQSASIVFTESDIQDSPDLASRTPLSDRIRAMLRREKLTLPELSRELDQKEDTVYRQLKKMPDIVQLQSGGGRGRASEWGLQA